MLVPDTFSFDYKTNANDMLFWSLEDGVTKKFNFYLSYFFIEPSKANNLKYYINKLITKKSKC